MNCVYFGDCRESLQKMIDIGIKPQMCVTSPPYFGLRDYGVEGQLGLEQTPEDYVAGMVEVFRLVREVLSDDGVLFLNIGDSYNAAGRKRHGTRQGYKQGTNRASATCADHGRANAPGLKPKDLIGIPWMLAFALRADGWYLRQDIIWAKPNPMPESVKDRCTRSHEHIFMFSKREKYFYNAAAIRTPMKKSSIDRLSQDVDAQTGSTRANGGAKTNGTMKAVGKIDKQSGHGRRHAGFNDRWDAMSKDDQMAGGANKRDVWMVSAGSGYKGAHFAVFPPALIEPCILAGSRTDDIVLDPFFGSGTTGQVAIQHGRQFIGCELNRDYQPLIAERIAKAGGDALYLFDDFPALSAQKATL